MGVIGGLLDHLHQSNRYQYSPFPNLKGVYVNIEKEDMDLPLKTSPLLGMELGSINCQPKTNLLEILFHLFHRVGGPFPQHHLED